MPFPEPFAGFEIIGENAVLCAAEERAIEISGAAGHTLRRRRLIVFMVRQFWLQSFGLMEKISYSVVKSGRVDFSKPLVNPVYCQCHRCTEPSDLALAP